MACSDSILSGLADESPADTQAGVVEFVECSRGFGMNSSRPVAASEAHTERLDLSPLVLLVDDFEDAREMYADFLGFSGFRTDQASDGHEAIAKAFSLRPDVILMDLSLPGIDGWEVTRRLKRDPRTRTIPVIALTAHALNGDERRARGAGCDSFVSKPCLPQTLVSEILRILGRGPTAPV
jgi:two-component system, cell cycle response regulator DivK